MNLPTDTFKQEVHPQSRGIRSEDTNLDEIADSLLGILDEMYYEIQHIKKHLTN